MKDQPGSTKMEIKKIFFYLFLFLFLLHSITNLKLYSRAIEDLNNSEKICGLVKSYTFGGGKSTGWNLLVRNADYDKYTFKLSKDYIQSKVNKNDLFRNRKICIEYINLKYSLSGKFIIQVYLDDAVLDEEEVVKKYLYESGWPSWLIFMEFFMTVVFLIAINRRRK